MLPLCRRMRDAVPSFFNSTGVAGALLSARGALPEGEVVSATSVDMAMSVPVDVVLGGVSVARLASDSYMMQTVYHPVGARTVLVGAIARGPSSGPSDGTVRALQQPL